MIKNYTSTVPFTRSVQHIEDRLVRFGAKNIMKIYDDNKRLEGIYFIVNTPQGKDIPFKLPAKVDNVEKVLRGLVKRHKTNTVDRLKEQAERTAWKIVSDWVDIQLSLIELTQVEMMEIFLPYVWFPAEKQTYFERLKGNGFKLLTQDGDRR